MESIKTTNCEGNRRGQTGDSGNGNKKNNDNITMSDVEGDEAENRKMPMASQNVIARRNGRDKTNSHLRSNEVEIKENLGYNVPMDIQNGQGSPDTNDGEKRIEVLDNSMDGTKNQQENEYGNEYESEYENENVLSHVTETTYANDDKKQYINMLINPEVKQEFCKHIADLSNMKNTMCFRNTFDFYRILNLTPDASSKEIRRNYLIFSKLLKVHTIPDDEKEQIYHLIKKSYKTLSDEFEKYYYDVLKTSRYEDVSQMETERKLLELKADEIYKSALNEFKNLALEKRKEEIEKDGLVIEKALYGNLRLKDEYIKDCLRMKEIKEHHLKGPFYDVTIILQAKVEKSKLIINEESTYAYFCGIPKPLIKIPADATYKKPITCNNYIRNTFFKKLYYADRNLPDEDEEKCETRQDYLNVLEDAESHLYIKYKFLNTYHEITAADRVNFILPLSCHRTMGNCLSGPFSPANVDVVKKMRNSIQDYILDFFSKHKIHIAFCTTLLFSLHLLKAF